MEKFNTHGGYFSPNGYFKVNEGGSHEENPNGGVQVGVDPQGVPNMLEEGEPVYNDYVYSDNILADEAFLEKHNIPKKYAGKLYSKIADSIVDEAEERPLDAISNSGLEAMLTRLADAQEEQKAEQQKRELEEELSNMSPEELDQLEAMLAQQEGAEQQAMQEEQMVQDQMMAQQGIPQQAVSPKEQMMQQMPQQGMPMGCGGHMKSCGGFIRKYEPGGYLKSDPPEQPTLVNVGTKENPVYRVAAQPQLTVTQNTAIDPNDEYLIQIAGYNKDNPMGIWADNDDAFKARRWMFDNHPDVMRQWYGQLSDEQKAQVPMKMLSRDMQSEYVANAASGAMDKFGREYMPWITSGPMLAEGLITAPLSTVGSIGGSYAGGYAGRKVDEAMGNETPYGEIAGTLLGAVVTPGAKPKRTRSEAAQEGWKTRRAKQQAAEQMKANDKLTESLTENNKALAERNTGEAQQNPQSSTTKQPATEAEPQTKTKTKKDKNNDSIWHGRKGGKRHDLFGEGFRSAFAPGHNLRRAISFGKQGHPWRNAFHYTLAGLEDVGAGINVALRAKQIAGSQPSRFLQDAYKNNYYTGNVPTQESDTSKYFMPLGTYRDGGQMNKYGTGGPLEDLVKEYVKKTGNFPDPAQYAILQRLANLGTLSDDDYAALDKRFSARLNTNKVRPAEEFGTVNKDLLGRRINPDVYNGGQLDSIVVNPRDNDTVYDGGNLDSIFVRPAPDVYDGGQLDSIVVSPRTQRDTLFTSSTELNPITVTAERPAQEESYSTDYLWKNIGSSIEQKQRPVSKGVVTVGGKVYDPATRQFIDPKTYAGKRYYIPLYGDNRSDSNKPDSPSNPKGTSTGTSSASTKTNNGTPVDRNKYALPKMGVSPTFGIQPVDPNKKLAEGIASDKRTQEYDQRRREALYKAMTEEKKDSSLPTWMRYAGIANSGIQALWNALQKPDRYQQLKYNPVLPNGRMHLIDPVFNPLDENMVVNDLLNQSSGTVWGLRNSGLSSGALANSLIAADYNAGRNMGTARTNIWDANNQRRNDVIARRNANEQTLGQFRYGIDRDRAGILNAAALENLRYDLLMQRLNNEAQTQKYEALSNNLNALSKGLAGIGQENFSMNQINGNPYFDYVTLADGRTAYVPKQAAPQTASTATTAAAAPASTAAQTTPAAKTAAGTTTVPVTTAPVTTTPGTTAPVVTAVTPSVQYSQSLIDPNLGFDQNIYADNNWFIQPSDNPLDWFDATKRYGIKKTNVRAVKCGGKISRKK